MRQNFFSDGRLKKKEKHSLTAPLAVIHHKTGMVSWPHLCWERHARRFGVDPIPRPHVILSKMTMSLSQIVQNVDPQLFSQNRQHS